MAYLSGWTKRVPLTVDYTKVGSGGVANFPMLAPMTLPDEVVAGLANPDGRCIRFCDDAATTVYPHELVSINGAEWQAWVRVPQIMGSSDTTIYMNYGNASATMPSAAEQQVTWSGYTAVWHLGDNADSTGNGYTLETDTGVSYVNGKIGTCVQIPRGKVLKHAADDIPVPAEFMVSGWYRRVAGTSQNNFVAGHSWALAARDIITGKMRGHLVNSAYYVDSGSIGLDWARWGFGISDGTMYPLNDGVWGTAGPQPPWSGGNYSFGFGYVYQATTREISCDETRIGPFRDNAWLATEYANQSNPDFSAWGPVESLSSYVPHRRNIIVRSGPTLRGVI